MEIKIYIRKPRTKTIVETAKSQSIREINQNWFELKEIINNNEECKHRNYKGK